MPQSFSFNVLLDTALLSVVCPALSCYPFYRRINGLIFGLSVGLSVGLIVGLIFGLSVDLSKIQIQEQLTWSPRKSLQNGLIFGLSVGLIFVLINGLIFGLSVGLNVGLIFVLIKGLIKGLMNETIKQKQVPNQGIKKSLQNGLSFGLSFGLIDGLSFGLSFGLIGVIQHFILRIVLTRNGVTPWNYAQFLEHAVKHRFIQRTGGRYRFIHDLLRQHFAQMTPEQQALLAQQER